jgi:5-methylcytosine-specific restriction enzyme A
MAAKAWRVCTNPTCPELHQGQGRCPSCTNQADRNRRPDGNPYNTAGHQRFRSAVLARDPICVLCDIAISTVADHHPLERRELVTRGLNPDDPDRGRGVCKRCHDRHTAESNPAGWNRAF